MAKLFQKIKDSAKLDSRRHGKGTVCRILEGAQIIDILRRYSLIPGGCIFIPDKDWAITVDGRFFVVPVFEYKALKEELESIGDLTPFSQLDNSTALIKNAAKDSRAPTAALVDMMTAHTNIIELLRQTMIMVRIPNHRCPGNNVQSVNPNTYDILIETLDVGQTLDGSVVNRNVFGLNRKGGSIKDD